jgi:hypoxanthine-DNA glycosylase
VPVILQALPQVAASDARLLVLGSMPGAESLRRQQYYANPRNQFWRLVFASFGQTDPGTYPERVAFLLENRIALWDVLETCVREGSLDANIARGSEHPNDIPGFLRKHSGVRRIALNGGKAAQLFQSLVAPHLGPVANALEVLAMPSTSPAHTCPFATKMARWKVAFER